MLEIIGNVFANADSGTIISIIVVQPPGLFPNLFYADRYIVFIYHFAFINIRPNSFVQNNKFCSNWVFFKAFLPIIYLKCTHAKLAPSFVMNPSRPLYQIMQIREKSTPKTDTLIHIGPKY